MKSRIDNLISISFLFHRDMDNSIMDMDPSYLIEKWNKFIGFIPIIYINDEKSLDVYMDYCKRWRVGDEVMIKITPIMMFITEINKKSIKSWYISDIINVFEKNIGDINNINDTVISYGLHPLLRLSIANHLDTKLVRRDYNLLILDEKI